VATWEQSVRVPGVQRPVRRVLRLVERTIGSRGQHLILPEYELDGWTTTRPARIDAEQVIALHAEHGTHEQFHAEFKTDMEFTRLPSGRFDTNALVCRLAALAMNILPLMGQRGLLGPDTPVRHQAKRRRIKTVMQELILPRGPVDRAWPVDAARAECQRPRRGGPVSAIQPPPWQTASTTAPAWAQRARIAALRDPSRAGREQQPCNDPTAAPIHAHGQSIRQQRSCRWHPVSNCAVPGRGFRYRQVTRSCR
jgi:transposase, IS4 family